MLNDGADICLGTMGRKAEELVVRAIYFALL